MSTIRNARLPDGRSVDLSVVDGIVTAVDDAAGSAAEPDDIDAAGRLALTAFVEPHAHLDKAYTADLVPNPAGDLMGAIAAWSARHPERTVEEITGRARRAALAALANGAAIIRTHVDVTASIRMRAVEALVGVRAELADLVDIQIVALMGRPLSGTEGGENRALLAEAIDMGVDLVGGCPHLDDDPQGLIDHVFQAATDRGLGVDLHVDETLDPSMRTLDLLARSVLSTGFDRPVAASHCVSLGMRPEAEQQECAELVAEADIGVITLPQTNLFLQARGVATAPARGLTALDALAGAGVRVAAGGDNVQDPFNTVGRNDPLESAALLVMAGHREPTTALSAVSGVARSLVGAPVAGPIIGAAADLVLVDAETERQVVAEGPPARTVIRGGRMVAETSVRRALYR